MAKYEKGQTAIYEMKAAKALRDPATPTFQGSHLVCITAFGAEWLEIRVEGEL